MTPELKAMLGTMGVISALALMFAIVYFFPALFVGVILVGAGGYFLLLTYALLLGHFKDKS